MQPVVARAETGDGFYALRTLKHLFTLPGAVERAFPAATLARITEEIAASERRHTGETRFAVEGALPWSYLWKNLPARSRALMVFSSCASGIRRRTMAC